MKADFNKDFVPVVVYVKLLDHAFGEEWRGWEPETLWEVIASHFVGSISDTAKSAIQAARTLMINDLYFEDLNAFEDITLGLNNLIPNFEVIEVCSPAEILYGYRMMKALRQSREFTPEVTAYIQACFKQAGQQVYPDELKGLQGAVEHEAAIVARSKNISADKVDVTDYIDVQAAKLADCRSYANARIAEARRELANVG